MAVEGAFNLLVFGAIMLVTAGITAAIGAQVTANIQTSIGTNTFSNVSYYVAGNATSGIGNLASQLPNVGTVIAAAAIIGILMLVMSGFVGRQGGE